MSDESFVEACRKFRESDTNLKEFGFRNNEIKLIKDICSKEGITQLGLFRQTLRQWQIDTYDIDIPGMESDNLITNLKVTNQD